MFHLFFKAYVLSVFIWMLHMLYIYVISVLSGCYICLQWLFKCVFLQVLQTYVFSVSSAIFCMLQVLHLYSKVDRDVGHIAMVFQVYAPNISSILDLYYKYFN